MKQILLSITLLFVGMAVFAQNVAFSSADLDGNKITDEIFSNADVTVVNVWGTFCPPCIREMPELAAWQKSMPKNVQIIGIVCDVTSSGDKRGVSNAKAILKRAGATFTNIVADESLSTLLNGIQFVPTTFLVDKNGGIVGEMIVGAQVAKYKKAVEDYLAKK